MESTAFWRLILGVAAALLAAGGAVAQTPVRFSLDWRWEGPAAIFAVALDKGYFKAEGLDVTIDPASGSREPISRVASGTYDMGFGELEVGQASVGLQDTQDFEVHTVEIAQFCRHEMKNRW